MVLQARGGRVPSLGRNECGARGYHVAGLTSGGRARLWAARAQNRPLFLAGSSKNERITTQPLEITRGALVASGCSAQPGTRARSEARQSVAMTLEATDPKVRPPPHPRRHPPQHPRVAPHPPKARVPNLEAESEYPLLEIARELHPNIARPPVPDSIRRRLRPARPPPRWRASRTRSPTPS